MYLLIPLVPNCALILSCIGVRMTLSPPGLPSSGKSRAVSLLAKWFLEQGRKVEVVREGEQLGELDKNEVGR